MSELHRAALVLLGHAPREPSGELAPYLDSYRFTHFRGREYVDPSKPALPLEYYIKAAAQAALHDELRAAAGSAITIASFYRPPGHNQGGAPKSDHLTADACDLRFASHRAARRGVERLRPFWESGLLQISLGLYHPQWKRIHVGMLVGSAGRWWVEYGAQPLPWFRR
ncbi:MAG: D-Ala-D-Ala carboxypeptidase family metallohydrolase [Solirubrobacterales bacterium]